MAQAYAYTLTQLSKLVSDALARTPQLFNVWIVAETVDVRPNRGGHCYLELLEKDANGNTVAKCRALIWDNVYREIIPLFEAQTGQRWRNDLKVMVCVTVNYHQLYGLSVVIHAINPAYTLGEAARRRAEMIARLKAEGIIDLNKSLQHVRVPQRIAIISGRTAAGYGDFIHQLYNNQWRLRFRTTLFRAAVQGAQAPSSIIAALESIRSRLSDYDCVVLIRGGGATSDLACFEDYELAAHIAKFPLPVIIGIGHERDTTLLDSVANMRVKTPTAAAEWLISRGEAALGQLQEIARQMLLSVRERLNGSREQLAYYAGRLPVMSQMALGRAERRLLNVRAVLAAIPDRRLRPELIKLDTYAGALTTAVDVAMQRQRQRLDVCGQLLDVLSPEATLRRGYSITRVQGRAVASAADVTDEAIIETTLALGVLVSRKIKCST